MSKTSFEQFPGNAEEQPGPMAGGEMLKGVSPSRIRATHSFLPGGISEVKVERIGSVIDIPAIDPELWPDDFWPTLRGETRLIHRIVSQVECRHIPAMGEIAIRAYHVRAIQRAAKMIGMEFDGQPLIDSDIRPAGRVM